MAEQKRKHLLGPASVNDETFYLYEMSKKRTNVNYITAAIIGLIGGLFLLSPSITGNLILDVNLKTATFYGSCLIILGVIIGLFWSLDRKNKLE